MIANCDSFCSQSGAEHGRLSTMKSSGSMNDAEREAVTEAHRELAAAMSQMIDKDDQIICNHVRRAEGMLASILTITQKEEK